MVDEDYARRPKIAANSRGFSYIEVTLALLFTSTSFMALLFLSWSQNYYYFQLNQRLISQQFTLELQRRFELTLTSEQILQQTITELGSNVVESSTLCHTNLQVNCYQQFCSVQNQIQQDLAELSCLLEPSKLDFTVAKGTDFNQLIVRFYPHTCSQEMCIFDEMSIYLGDVK